MAKYNAYMQFWIGDYLTDTTNLSAQRHGMYILMIFYYWKNAELPDDVEEIYEIAKARDAKGNQDAIYIKNKYFPNGKHKRCDEELAKAKASYDKRCEAQKKSIEKRKANGNANCNANAKQGAMHLQSSDSDYDSDLISKEDKFDKFWKAYPKKKSKGAALKAWNKFKPTLKTFEVIMSGLKNAKASPEWLTENGTYIPYPATWLNAEGWLDEFGASASDTVEIADPFVLRISELKAMQDKGVCLMADGKEIRIQGGYFDFIGEEIPAVQTYGFLKAGGLIEPVNK